jgi:hypothetical protein
VFALCVCVCVCVCVFFGTYVSTHRWYQCAFIHERIHLVPVFFTTTLDKEILTPVLWEYLITVIPVLSFEQL